VRAEGDLRIGELLDLFRVLVAGSAFVFVERHDIFSDSSLLRCRAKRETWLRASPD